MNADKKGMLGFGRGSKGEDYFSGSIYQVNDKFLQKFISNKQRIYDSKCKPVFDGIDTKKDVVR